MRRPDLAILTRPWNSEKKALAAEFDGEEDGRCIAVIRER
jgi:hypothetical protein